MENSVNLLNIITADLPQGDAQFAKLFPILQKRVERRCATQCVENASDGFALRFVLDPSLPKEAFRFADDDGGICIFGGDFLALLYGAGQFLHKSHYRREGILPTAWRGLSVPQREKRMIFFAQHFYNWYQCCSAEEMQEHIEDLALWGINGVVSVFSCLNLTGWDDPNLTSLASLFRTTLLAAKSLGLKVGMEFSNVDFMNPREDVAADKSFLFSATGNLICPSTEEGFLYYQEMLSRVLHYSDDIGLDFITLWGYDEGGCCCEKCRPWGGNGFYRMAHRVSRYLRANYPKMEIWLATWHYGRVAEEAGEWELLYRHLQEDAEKGDDWADYLLLETRDDFPAHLFPAEHGQPTKHVKLLTFPDVSMTGVTPWGGFGAICTPELLLRQETPFAKLCNGGYLYTEGIFDDMNKAVMAGLYWDFSRSPDETIRDYCGYEFKGINGDDLASLIHLIEQSQLSTNRFLMRECPLHYCEEAWTLAQKIDAGAAEETRKYWKWRIIYIRAYLDFVRYHACAAAGWPWEKYKGIEGMIGFWGSFLENDARSQEYLLELIRLYKAKEVNDPALYSYHWYVRPPYQSKKAVEQAEKSMLQGGMEE